MHIDLLLQDLSNTMRNVICSGSTFSVMNLECVFEKWYT